MIPFRIAILGGVVVLAAGCTDSPGPSAGPSLPPLPSGPPVVAPVAGPKPSFVHAQELSDQVKVGMTQETVESMFGPPDKAGYKTYGRATPTPWQALEWEWVFQDVVPHRVFWIAFQRDPQGVWRV
ncbi:MAG: outer membrane protein assembly factor BamE, partial [Akkermansiaceae bacterium]|nr:outer membrane protein assembly factor BamE [Akkermansiaceae bacterium]